jgi:hypothetical protein
MRLGAEGAGCVWGFLELVIAARSTGLSRIRLDRPDFAAWLTAVQLAAIDSKGRA